MMNFKNILSNEIKHAVLHNNCLEEKEIWDDYIKSKSSKRKRTHRESDDIDSKHAKYMELKEREIRKNYKIQNELKILEKKKKNCAKIPNQFDWTGASDRWTHDLYENPPKKPYEPVYKEIHHSEDDRLSDCESQQSANSITDVPTEKILEKSQESSNEQSVSKSKHKKKSKSKKKSKKRKKSSKSPVRKSKSISRKDSSDIIWIERE